MGYFPNGTAGDVFQARYCDNCANADEHGACPIWDAHLLYNYELCNSDAPGKVMLDMLITRDENLVQHCTMFRPKGEETALEMEGQHNMFGEVP